MYALTARLLLDGGDLYGGLIASQPPWVYLFGAGALWFHDSIDALRLACGLLQVLTGMLAARAVWLLTGSRVAAVAAAPLVVVLPWATHEHGLLQPEQLGAPLLLGAALLAARPATARWAGVAAGIAVFAKVPFALPVVMLIAFAPARAVVARWTAAVVAAQAVAFTALFGWGFWRQIVEAQIQAGGGGLELQIGAWVQAGWTLLALLVFAVVAFALRDRAREPELLPTVGVTALGALATTVTIVKPGTGLNVLMLGEPLVATLAVAGVSWSLQSEMRVRPAVAATALGLLMLAQSTSLLLDPANPRPFHRPLSASPGWKVGYTRDEVDRLVAQAERCPPGTVYPGPQLVAFIVGRRVPADQPDVFIVSCAEMHAAALARLESDGPRCP